MQNTYKLAASASFKKRFKKLICKDDNLRGKIENALLKLADAPFSISLHTHKVSTRKYGKKYSSSVSGDLRIIWDFRNGKVRIIDLYDLGGHGGKKGVY